MIAKKEARILMVDDEKQAANMLVDYLSNLGCLWRV
jgi:CheY-like chemotaxis protein